MDSDQNSTVECRREPRVEGSLQILIWGIDAKGVRFAQSALARNISGQGALITGMDQHLRAGDLIGVQYEKNSARFRVVWSRDSGNGEKVRAAVQKLEREACPWERELSRGLGIPLAAVEITRSAHHGDAEARRELYLSSVQNL